MKVIMIHPHDVETSPWTVRMTKLAEELENLDYKIQMFYFEEPQRRKIGYHTASEADFNISLIKLKKYSLFKNFRILLNACKNTDIIYIQKCFAHVVLPSLFVAFILNIPVHYDWDDWEEGITRDYLGKHPFTKLISYYERNLPFLVDTISVSSDALYQRTVNYGFDPAKICKVPVGADFNQFSPAVKKANDVELQTGKGTLIAYAGQIEGANYAPLFIKAAADVLKSVENVHFIVVGGGYRLAELKKIAFELLPKDKISFTGYILHSKIPEVLAIADICVATFEDNPVTQAKSPLKIVEYMALQKPIIASAVGEVKEMLANSGILVPSGNSNAIAKAIIKLIKKPELGRKLAQNARQKVLQTYNWHHGAKQLDQLWKKL